MFNRGTKYLQKGENAKALSYYKKQEKIGKFKELYLNMGNAYKLLGNNKKAMDCFLLAASPNMPFLDGSTKPYSLAYGNIGFMEYLFGNDEMSMEFYRAALTIDPLYGEGIWNYGNACLRASNSTKGWQYYEYRFNRGVNSTKIDTSVPRWDGKSSGSRIVVITEQGYGDKIMYGRYLPYLEKYFSEVVVCCHPTLNCLYTYETVSDCSGFDVSIPLCSLAGIFGLVEENWMDGRFKAYRYDTTKNIGVCWNGSPNHANNDNRSCASSYFSSLNRFGTLYSISPDPKVVKNILPITSRDWAETASYVLGLDLVISVDTSIVHLAGTLGVPCIMIQPTQETDFRWGPAFPNEEPYFGNNPWYKSVMVVPNRGWDVAFKIVESKINV